MKKNIANRPAPTRNIVVFAVRSERTRKIESRTSGAFERCSITTNETSRTADRTSVPIVCTDVQPFSGTWTIANTSDISPAVTATAPATSKLRCAASSFDSGRYQSESANTAIPTGTLMKKIHGQERSWVSAPPTIRPTALPPIAIAAHTPSAFARSAPSSKVVLMIARAAGEMKAAPSPWSPRQAISIVEFTARPFSSEAAVKTTRPNRNRRLRPSRSPARPPRSRRPPNASV